MLKPFVKFRSQIGAADYIFDIEQMAFFTPPAADRAKWSAIFRPFQPAVSFRFIL
jgi:hypothetical protein